MSQAPIGYWKFETPESDQLANDVLQGITASSGLEVAFGAPGMGPKNGFNGFSETNNSAQLLGDGEKSALVDLGGPKGVTRRKGAVSYWIRHLPENQKEETLWLAGENKSDGSAPEISPIHTTLTDSGRIRLFIENGKFDMEFTSSRNLADGKWHHIVASWGPTKVTLFVDGQLAATDEDSRSLQGGTFFGRYVRFGKPRSDLRLRDVQPFKGWVDELALWNRPLNSVEVKRQFQSAIGLTISYPTANQE